jgi:hypothetical protein
VQTIVSKLSAEGHPAKNKPLWDQKLFLARKITISLPRHFENVDEFLHLQWFVIKKRQFNEASNSCFHRESQTLFNLK